MTIEILMSLVKNYSEEDKKKILDAYLYASNLHDGQYRQSGEPYIVHPLNVAYILAEMNADCDTICAGLLHDTIEDTKATKEDIAHDFNPTVANLVDGVTKLAKMNFSNRQAYDYANTRKIISGITNDVRIIIIKLADRLHNMRTLQFKSEQKQKENALETIEIFVPLAYCIGAYRIKSELEDLSLRYLKPDDYKKISEEKEKLEYSSVSCLGQMISRIKYILEDENIPSEIKYRTKNIYGIYKRIQEGQKLSDIHDLIALKIAVDTVNNCYLSLGLIHKEYHPINGMFKDYICNPKTNMYSSLHTTVFAPDDRLVQTQIRTFSMDKIDSFGLSYYWSLEKGDARDRMQRDLKERYQFFKSLIEIDSVFGDNSDFVRAVKMELFADKVYVYTTAGKVIELPVGSTPIDFAYKIHTDLGNNIVSVYVNDEEFPITGKLKNQDRVRIISSACSSGPKEEWLDVVRTTTAKKKIKEFIKKNI